jgi:two-component system, OmpR family, response regulator CpxR
MSTITVFAASFCQEDEILEKVSALTGHPLLRDGEVIARAAQLTDSSEDKLRKALTSSTSVFNRFTHEKERSIAGLRCAVAEILAGGDSLLAGFSSRLVPDSITHVLRVCLVAETSWRADRASEAHQLSPRDAAARIKENMEDAGAWCAAVLNQEDPWDPSFYDIVIPIDKTTSDTAVALIAENGGKDVIQITESSRRKADDFLLAARVGLVLATNGHNVAVEAEDGQIAITINKQVLLLNRLEEELKGIAEQVSGVQGVRTRVGSSFHQADVYRKYHFEAPNKVLLVDDEREFVQTLSERLIMREVGSAVAYDGASALEMVRDDEPDVMILDLKMPGIDGLEVLRRVKKENPSIEVIILTGHGSDVDRQECMELGAYAYLQKPVDIEVLSRTLREANELVQKRRRTAE